MVATTDFIATSSGTSTAVAPSTIEVAHLGIDERSWVLQILITNRRRRPIGERAQRSGGVVAGVLRIGACARHEQIGHVPALQIAIDRARRSIGAHDSATTYMRRLILPGVIGRLAIHLRDLVGTHRLDDFGKAIGQEGVLLDLVVVEIHGYSHQRTAEAVAIGRVEIEVDITIAVEASMHAGAGHDAAEIVVAYRGLPCRAPCRRPWRGGRCLNRTAVGLDLSHIATANKAMWAMVEIVAVELIDAHA